MDALTLPYRLGRSTPRATSRDRGPFARRGERTAEDVAVMRTLWSDDLASFRGEFTSFEAVRVNPSRSAAFADGWYGFNLTMAVALERIAALAGHAQRHGRRWAS
jgi:hypothetical protein